MAVLSMSLIKYCFTTIRRNFNNGSGTEINIVNFGERTLTWITDSVHSHMDDKHDTYPFNKDKIKLLSSKSTNIKSLIPCSEQITSQWFINQMISNKSYIHAFAKMSGNFDFLKNKFKLSDRCQHTKPDPEASENDHANKLETLYDKENRIKIEKADIDSLRMEWIDRHNYNEYFDIIWDELALDNIITMDMDNYVQTTLYGLALKQSGILYVVDRKIPGDMAGTKLRAKIGNLYPNTHFELIAERDTAWTTQFLFLKTHSCKELDTNREMDRKDHIGDDHYEYNQYRIHNESEVMKNAGRDMREGMDRVMDALGIKKDEEGPKF